MERASAETTLGREAKGGGEAGAVKREGGAGAAPLCGCGTAVREAAKQVRGEAGGQRECGEAGVAK